MHRSSLSSKVTEVKRSIYFRLIHYIKIFFYDFAKEVEKNVLLRFGKKCVFLLVVSLYEDRVRHKNLFEIVNVETVLFIIGPGQCYF